MAAYVFQSGSSKTAKIPITVTPSNLGCQVELYLGPNQSTKTVTSGQVTFTSTGSSQNVNVTITLPTTAGAYNVYIDITSGGYLIGAYIDSNTIVIPSGSIGPIVWS